MSSTSGCSSNYVNGLGLIAGNPMLSGGVLRKIARDLITCLTGQIIDLGNIDFLAAGKRILDKSNSRYWTQRQFPKTHRGRHSRHLSAVGIGGKGKYCRFFAVHYAEHMNLAGEARLPQTKAKCNPGKPVAFVNIYKTSGDQEIVTAGR